jgi:hypothetical protein
MFDSGLVYYPDRKWAGEVIDLVATFPNGAPPSADVTDTITQAVNYVRRRGWASMAEDESVVIKDGPQEYEEDAPPPKRAAYG